MHSILSEVKKMIYPPPEPEERKAKLKARDLIRPDENALTGKYNCKVCKVSFLSKKAYDKHRKTQAHKTEEKLIG